MNRKALSLILILAMLTLSLLPGWSGQSGSMASIAPPGADLYIKDTPLDSGVEPNPDGGPMWVTEDIWVRTTPDPGYQPFPFPEAAPPWAPLPHENPEYRDPKFSVPNYVYVRVRNRGTAASDGNEQLRLYWTKASTGLAWPTQWGGAGVDFQTNTCGPTKSYGAEVTKPRKNAGRATVAERAAYINAILNVGQPAFTFPAWGSTSYWHKQQEVHSLGPVYRHGTPAFLPWHREFVNRYEALLREFDPTVKLLYWDWTTDPENSTNGFNLFTSTFMGASGRGTGGVSIGDPFIPGAGATLAPPPVTRNLSVNTTPPANADATLMGKGTYGPFAAAQNSFAWDTEKVPNHNSAHGYIGGGGDMSFVNASTKDPFFFLLHGNVDRLWAQWQRNVSNLSRLDPATTYDSETANANITVTEGPWDGSGTAIEPWTAAGGYIVSKTATDPSIVSPPIYDCARLVVPVLQPGEAVVLQIPWFPPNPADFACFGGDQGHFCLLGRIETGSAAQCEDIPSPFGMTFPEGANVSTNTRNNNNIAWKNITVVDSFPGAFRLTSILIRNAFRERVVAGLRIAAARDIDASFFEHGRVFLNLKPDLLKRWRDGGMKGQGLKAVSDRGGQRIEITGGEALLENIQLEPGETHSVDLHFEIPKNYQPLRGTFPKFDLIQTGAPGKPDEIVGGQRFIVDLSKIVLIEEGDTWRYLDTGQSPRPRWTAVAFDDSKWKSGKAELGFGSEPMTTINPGPANRRNITSFFRHTFDVADPSFYRSLIVRLKRDDGAIVYLNGKEISRVNLPAGAITVGQLATRDVSGLEEDVFFPTALSPGLLNQGKNVVAVEVHQSSPRSDDVSFDLELLANPASSGFAPDVGFGPNNQAALFQRGEAIPINIEAIDSDGKVSSVSFFADGKLVSRSDRAPFNFQWREADLGRHRLRAVAMDGDRQTGEAFATISVVKNVPPAVMLDAPRNEAVFRAGETITAAARASDRLGRIDRVEFHIRDDQLFASVDRLAGTAKSPPYTINIRGLAPGHYMLLAIAWDNQGLAGSSVPVHFEVKGQRSNH